MYSIYEYDKLKSKVLKYVLYKKRTENEVRQKFYKEIEENTLEDIIQELKDNLYINDYKYIEKAVNEYVNLKTLSIKELKYKLYAKGLDNKLIDEYMYENKDFLKEYEVKSAYKLINKKSQSLDEEEIKMFLLKKGYEKENINIALEGEE